MSDLCNPELLDKAETGAATSAELAALDAHAAVCTTCARELAWQRRERALFTGRSRGDVATLWADVEARIATPAVQPRRPASWTAGLVAAAAALLLMVKVVPMAMHREPQKLTVIPAQGAGLPTVEHVQQRTRQWSEPLPNDGRLVVSSVDGSVDVAMADRKDVLVIAETDPDFESSGWTVKVERKGKELSVRVECLRTCEQQPEVELHVMLPASSHVKTVVDTIAADVEVHGVTAPVVAHTVSGDVEIDGTNLAEVATTSGDVSIDHAPSAASKVSTVSGDVLWNGLCAKGCELRVSTVSGDIEIDPEAGSAFKASAETSRGRRTRETPNAKGEIRLTTVSGDIDLPGLDDAHEPSEPVEPSAGPIVIGTVGGGVVKAVKVKVGDSIEKGQTVVELDAAAAAAELASLRAELEAAEHDVKVIDALYARGAVTATQLGQARSVVAIARAKLDAPEAKLGQAHVRSYSAGTVHAVLVRAGQALAPNSPVVEIELE